jgi:hypothetical protein
VSGFNVDSKTAQKIVGEISDQSNLSEASFRIKSLISSVNLGISIFSFENNHQFT